MSTNELVSSYLSRVQEAIKSIDPTAISNLVEAVHSTMDIGGKIILAGNGGSASTANHMVNDIVMARNFNSASGVALSLSDNQAIFSAIANDFSFNHVFSKQIVTIGNEKDLLVLISASGNSTNLVEAVQVAKKVGMKTAAITGFDGGKLKALVDYPVHARTDVGDYGPAEDIALVVNHALAAVLKSKKRDAFKVNA